MINLNIELNSKDRINYPIIIGSSILAEISEFFLKFSSKKVVIVTNETIFELYEEKFPEMFAKTNLHIEYCVIPDGEMYKNQITLDKILTCAFEAKLGRDDLFVAFGGGVIGDITGFAAAIYLRGINFIQIPTTILAQVDSSIGGKVAINTPYGKNLLGAFYQPKAVISDLDFLKTLPKREVLTGLSEVIKYSFIEKTCESNFVNFANFLLENCDLILKNNENILEKTISRCCELKASVVAKDEKENGIRAILNFGHTIGHAIEKATEYNFFTHGEAISIGMKGAFLISLKLKKISKDYFDFAQSILDRYNFVQKISENVQAENIFQAISYDKKIKNGKLRFVLPVDYAQVKLFENIESELIFNVIKELY